MVVPLGAQVVLLWSVQLAGAVPIWLFQKKTTRVVL